jgi:hypothetical protein
LQEAVVEPMVLAIVKSTELLLNLEIKATVKMRVQLGLMVMVVAKMEEAQVAVDFTQTVRMPTAALRVGFLTLTVAQVVMVKRIVKAVLAVAAVLMDLVIMTVAVAAVDIPAVVEPVDGVTPVAEVADHIIPEQIGIISPV